MKRVIRRIVTVVTTEVWMVMEEGNGEESHVVRTFTVESVMKNDDHKMTSEGRHVQKLGHSEKNEI